jgi:hypothetical protein
MTEQLKYLGLYEPFKLADKKWYFYMPNPDDKKRAISCGPYENIGIATRHALLAKGANHE